MGLVSEQIVNLQKKKKRYKILNIQILEIKKNQSQK